MSRFRARAFLFPASIFLCFSLVLIPEAFAQSQGETTRAAVVGRVYDSTKEVVLSGTISEVVTRPKAGLPLGLHLMLETTQGQVDIHLGPYAGRIATQRGLVPGATIQVTGMTMHFSAGDVFLARTIVVGNQTLTIRNQNGMPIRTAPAGTRAASGASPEGGL